MAMDQKAQEVVEQRTGEKKDVVGVSCLVGR